MSKFAVIIAAAGQSSRFEQVQKKPFVEIAGKAIWLYSAEQFRQHEQVAQLILVISPDDDAYFNRSFADDIQRLKIDVVHGGKERADSVGNALEKIRPEIEMIAVHDAARPCIALDNIAAVFAKAEQTGAAILASPIAGTIKRVASDRSISETVSRESLWEAQTPQVFRRDILETAYQQRDDFQPTDEAQLVERNSVTVSVVTGTKSNLKITTSTDLRLARFLLTDTPDP